MTLHCASRVGLLSSLYQQRHTIAYALGLITEVPISMCSSDYDFSTGLVIHEDADAESTLPPIAFHTHEINLFCNNFFDLSIDTNRFALLINNYSAIIDHAYKTPALSIFHPPS